MELLLDLLERCEKLDIRGWYRAKEELAALREAGEKMAKILAKDLEQNGASSEIFYAIQAWEAANK